MKQVPLDYVIKEELLNKGINTQYACIFVGFLCTIFCHRQTINLAYIVTLEL